MCNLYSLTRNRDAILRLFRVSHNRSTACEPLSAIFPAHWAPVVRRAEDGERELVMSSWGFVLLQQGRAPRRVTNVRDDKVRTSAFWRPSFEQHRCLVPASSFCEPKGERPALWHWFALNGSEARPLFAFPGLWRTYRGPLKRNGEAVELEVFAFMTTTPNELVATINHERMPVLLTGEEHFATWLEGSPAEAFAPRTQRSTSPGGRHSMLRQQRGIQVDPVRVRSLDQVDLPRSQEALQRFLPLDRLLDVGKHLEPDELVHAITACELRADTFNGGGPPGREYRS